MSRITNSRGIKDFNSEAAVEKMTGETVRKLR